MKKLLRSVRRWSGLLVALEGRARLQCMLDALLGREVQREVVVGGVPLRVRTNTPDLDVAVSCLHDKEYDHIRCTAPQVIVDAGANIGASAVYFARKFPRALVIAIEPEAGNFALLQKNATGYGNIVTVQAALWGTQGKRTIQNRLTGHWGYTVSDTSNPTETTGQDVECITMEQLMAQHELASIDLLKMDIEGGELHVLEHSGAWITKVGILTVELHDRIVMGCDRAFYLATQSFQRCEKHGEMVTAYRT